MAKKKEPTPEEAMESQKQAEVAAAVISKPVLLESSEEQLRRMAYESKKILFERGLDKPFHPNEIKWKPQSVKGNRCLAIAYLDARTVMDRLDDVCGVDGWRDEFEFHSDGSVLCRLTLLTPSGLFMTKCDVGSPSEQPDAGDRKKAAVSDALKRAAVHFGIGRYLYRLPHQWVDYDPVKKRPGSVPKLPDWALPKKEIPSPAVYVEPDEVIEHGEAKDDAKKIPVAAAATGNDAETKEKIARHNYINGRVEWWNKGMAGCETSSQLSEYIRENLKDEPDVSKTEVWVKIQDTIRIRGWKWDKNRKEVYEPDESNKAIPY